MLNRPYAFAQWVQKANIPERYVLMAEPDHVMIRPIPNFMTSDIPGACCAVGPRPNHVLPPAPWLPYISNPSPNLVGIV